MSNLFVIIDWTFNFKVLLKLTIKRAGRGLPRPTAPPRGVRRVEYSGNQLAGLASYALLTVWAKGEASGLEMAVAEGGWPDCLKA